MALDIQKSRDGEPAAVSRLASRVLDRKEGLVGKVKGMFRNDEEGRAEAVIERARREIAEALTLYGGRVVFTSDVPEWSTSIIGRSAGFSSLSEYCYFALAETLSQDVRLGECVGCGFIFSMKDARQKFCEPACATRARARRYYAGTKKKGQD